MWRVDDTCEEDTLGDADGARGEFLASEEWSLLDCTTEWNEGVCWCFLLLSSLLSVRILSRVTNQVFLLGCRSCCAKPVIGRNKSQCNDNDNDNDTPREVQHQSNEGLALQARV